ERLDAAVVLVPAAVEHHFHHSSGLGAFGNLLADHFGCRDVAAALQILLGTLVRGTRGHQGFARAVVNDLRVNMVERAIHAHARPLREYFLPPRNYAAPAFAPALPAFFFRRWPVMRMPFCLYGSGGRNERMSAATCPT